MVVGCALQPVETQFYTSIKIDCTSPPQSTQAALKVC